ETNYPTDGRDVSSLLLQHDAKWSPRMLFSIWRNRVSIRDQRFRLDQNGALFDIENDRGQHVDVANQYPARAQKLRRQASRFRAEMSQLTATFADRPFTVGYAASTTLPARDGVPHGTIRRSSKAPNNSFFENWTSDQDSITWEITVAEAGEFDAIVYQTCRQSDVGVTIRIATDRGASTEQNVMRAFDPPLYDKSKERVANSHYFVKDFEPLSLGTLPLPKGRSTLRLSSPNIPGQEAIDVHSVELISTAE
ncbi:MAG: N-acetylgalactosamine 6-sulfate sulfatase, partial [Planctomycetota bacterium]